jgi:Flp pilus assembly pilin Flp
MNPLAKAKALLKRLAADEGGASAIEYAIMAAMVAGAIVLAVQTVGSALLNVFLNVGNAVL